MYLTKEVNELYTKSYELLVKESEEHMHKWKDKYDYELEE